jgi:3D (Asp-Asp-Asp) domain-containing protein
VGKTSSGATARHGTIAVDPKVYPTGTVFYIPGYGYAIAEDRGGAVKGASLELWFSTHKTALIWGRKKVEVKVWYPPGSKLKKKK